ncbi:hypothetical protein B0A48_14560 [Cryoendolithus antarcticus]|uniref:Phospholipid/glycerol acyltransferase domain-containing protein n=1 Tax=Cryoendolithus antarcticus TaxID=1507870 RepID=A0A1V8SLH2_9PEZI|nr:hypothetical protein B0A48_14560 [Cryoendolithus antarcticus]
MATSSVKSDAGHAGGGLTLTKSGANNPNPILHGSMGQAERAFSAGSTFLSGIMAISASQFIGAPLKLVDPKFYDSYMAWTKESFAVLMTTITQWWAPTVVRVSGDESMKGQLYQMDDGTLKCNFPHRLVLMANHQLYTDWLYLWWVAYTNKMHGHIYIILKESLKSIPIFGWSAQFYNFIFLSRKWETDKFRFKRALNGLKNPADKMWLLIFPEGTNLSAVTREKSAAWAKKTGTKDMKHQLLPRSTGLQFCLQELKQTTNWLYDCTIAYEGVPKGMYGQDVFTLKSSLFEGRPPKSVNMYWRRYRISEIPLETDEAFARWLSNRWREKDYILEYFYKFGQFPADEPVAALQAVKGKRPPNHRKAIATEVKGGGWDEFLSIYGPITSAAGALSAIDMTEPLNFDMLLGQVAKAQHMNLADLMRKAPTPPTSQEAIRQAIKAANKKKPLPKPVYDKLIADTPTTQKGMKRALQKSGDPEIAKRVEFAPSVSESLPSTTRENVTQAALRTQQAISAGQGPKSPAATQLASKVKTKAGVANTQAMVTRPLSTLAVQSAGGAIRKVAASRAQTKGPQSVPVVKKAGGIAPAAASSNANGAAKNTTARQPATKLAPSKAGSVTGPPKLNGTAKATPLTAANVAAVKSAPPKKKAIAS